MKPIRQVLSVIINKKQNCREADEKQYDKEALPKRRAWLGDFQAAYFGDIEQQPSEQGRKNGQEKLNEQANVECRNRKQLWAELCPLSEPNINRAQAALIAGFGQGAQIREQAIPACPMVERVGDVAAAAQTKSDRYGDTNGGNQQARTAIAPVCWVPKALIICQSVWGVSEEAINFYHNCMPLVSALSELRQG